MSKITYTFAADCPVAELRGVTVTGGVFCALSGKFSDSIDAVKFGDEIVVDGKLRRIIVKIAGKPELEAALAAHNAEKKAVADRLESIGWSTYQAAQSKAINARCAYDAASEHGYPAKQAAAMDAADEALDAVAAKYPLAEMYAKAESYSFASNYAKSAAGRQAMREIEQGGDVAQAIAKMESDWSDAAQRACDNS